MSRFVTPWGTTKVSIVSASIIVMLSGLLPGCGEPSAPEAISAAEKALAAGDASRAMVHLKNAATADPKNARARFLLGQSYAAAGDHQAATAEFARALELKYPPDEVARPLADALLLSNRLSEVRTLVAPLVIQDAKVAASVQAALAWAALGQQDLSSARQALDKAEEEGGPTTETRLIRARLADAKGDAEQALKLVDALLKDEPRHDSAWIFKGQLHERQTSGRAQAFEAYRQALAVNPKSYAALASIVGIHLLNKDLAAAREGLATMRKLEPKAFMTHYHGGQLKHLEGDYSGARGLFQQALSLAPDSTLGLLASGINELKLKAYPLAEGQLARVVQIEPANVEARFHLARTYLGEGKPDLASATLTPVIDTAAPPPELLIVAAQARLMQGDSKSADQLLTRAATLYPENTSVRLALALKEGSKGNTDAAVKELQRIAASTQDADADLQLIGVFLAREDYPAALAAIQALERKQPGAPAGDDLRGQVLARTGSAAEARKAFESALKKDAKYFSAVANLVKLDVQEGRPEQARARLESQAKLDPGNPAIPIALAALAQESSSKAPLVVEELEKAVRADPRNLQARLLLIERLYSKGDIQRALEAARSADTAIPDNAQIAEALAKCLVRSGDSRQALATYVKLTRLAPKEPAGYLGQARLLFDMKDAAGASRLAEQLLQIAPNNLEARRLVAASALLQKQPDKALTVSRDMQRDFPDNPIGYALEGEVHMDQKRWEQASAAFRSATAKPAGEAFVTRQHTALLNANKPDEANRLVAEWTAQHPKNAVLARHLAATAYNAGDRTQAKAYYEKALELAPKDPATLNNLAWILVENKDPGALPIAQRAAAEAPEDASVLDTLAQAYGVQGDYPKAIETMRRAIHHARAPAPFRLRLARLYLAANERANARAELESLRDLGPAFPDQAEVRRLLAQVPR